MQTFSIAIHGGASTLLKGMMTQEFEVVYKSTLKKAAEVGFEMLEQWKLAVDLFKAAVQLLEDSHLFNAGKGSVLLRSNLMKWMPI